jgi:predicted GNAT family N-acyltransferase
MPESVASVVEAAAPPAIFRAVTSVDELRAAFALRYAVYSREGWIAPDYDSAASRLELDGCDTTSLHLGLFLPPPVRRLVGYVRLITAQRQPDGEALTRAVVETTGDAVLRHAHAATYPEGLPVFASFPLAAFRRRLGERGWGHVELSRLVVREELRGRGLGARLVRGALAVAAMRRTRVVLVGCGLERVRMFQRLGFELLDTPILNYQRIDQPSRALWLRLDAARSHAGGTP